MPLSRGDEIKGRYKIIDILGKGGMGSVYLAEDWLHKEKCAIKEMLDNFSSDEERKDAIKRFQNEAQILVNIKHKNIPRIIDYFVENNCYYLVMKYIEGKNLQEIIMERKDGKFTEGEVIDLGVKLCDVLSYLHEQKPDPIVFRDIKPANIMFENNGNIMLIDFGIAKILQPRKAGTITGTPGFASPEQYQGFAYPVSDIYSLGATLYYLLSGRNPENSTPFNFPPLEHCVSDVEKVIMKAISMKIEERFQNVLDMKRALIYSRKTEIKMITEMREKVTPEEKVAPEEKVISEEKLEELFLVSEHVTGQSTEILRSTKSLSKKPLNKYIKLCFYITGLIILFICLYSLVNDYYRDRKIDHLCKEAEEFLKKDDYKNAIDRYEEVKKLKSDSIEAFRGAGKVYLKKGEYEHARLSLERAIDIDKDDEESYLTMAKVFWEQKDIFNAEIWYKKVLVINEDNIEAINGLGDCYFARKDYENAIAKYKKLLERDPQNIPLRMKIGYVYKEKKDYTNAIKWFTLALKVKDTFTEARLEIADIYIIVKKYDNAIEEYKKILKYKPQDVEAMSGIGECYKIQQNYDNAMKWFEETLKLKDDSVRGLRGKADILIVKKKNLKEARKNLDRALKLDPDDSLNYYSLGNYYVVKEDFNKAIENYKKSIKIDPDIACVHYDLGRVKAYLKKYDEAIEEYKKAIDLDPLDPYVHYNLGKAYYNKENIEEAVKEYNIAIKLKKDYIYPYHGLGLIYLKIGKFKEAIGYFKKVLEIEPGSDLAMEAEKGIKFAEFYGSF